MSGDVVATAPSFGEVRAPIEGPPDWYKMAVFYEVLVRSFRDSNADGTGDFRGVIEKVD